MYKACASLEPSWKDRRLSDGGTDGSGRELRLGLLSSPSHAVPRFLFPQVTIVEKADSCSVLPSPLSISTRNRMTFLFANLKDRDFLVQRISDFLQQTTSRIYSDREFSGSCNSSDDEVGGRHPSVEWGAPVFRPGVCTSLSTCLTVKFNSHAKPPAPVPSAIS